MNDLRKPVMHKDALNWGYRVLWMLCIGVYLTVFVSGLQTGGSELNTMLRAMGFTIATALIGKAALSVLGQATEPLSASQEGTVGSRIDLVSSPNVSEPEDEAEAA
jgi:hypothetical protein